MAHSIAAPSLIDLMRGRVTPGEWAQDLTRSLLVAEYDHEDAREDRTDTAAEAYADLERGLAAIGFELADFRTAEKSKRGARKGSRPWSQIRGPCGHQAAALIDDVERCTRIPAHALVTPSAVGLAHPPTAYLYHGHRANRAFCGLEISCRAAGIEGDPRTFWRRRSEKREGLTYAQLGREATDNQIRAGFLVCTYWSRLGEHHGRRPDLYCWHRNAHRSRVSDPGSRIARRLGVRLEGALELRPAGILGTGHPTPERWGGAEGVPYSWRVR